MQMENVMGLLQSILGHFRPPTMHQNLPGSTRNKAKSQCQTPLWPTLLKSDAPLVLQTRCKWNILGHGKPNFGPPATCPGPFWVPNLAKPSTRFRLLRLHTTRLHTPSGDKAGTIFDYGVGGHVMTAPLASIQASPNFHNSRAWAPIHAVEKSLVLICA